MSDIRRREAYIRLLVNATIASTATVYSDWWNVSSGQKFAVWVEALAGTSPEIDISLEYSPGLNGGGLNVEESVVTALTTLPATPYDSLSIDDRPVKSVRAKVTGTASNGADTSTSISLTIF